MSYQIELETKAQKLNDNYLIVKIPRNKSDSFTSRGQVMVEGLINNQPVKLPLEPDGNFGHWFNLNDLNLKNTKENLIIKLNQTGNWIEPNIPKDLMNAVKASPAVFALWKSITPMARWEWIRWINSTANSETRSKRITVTISKMNKGERRPCCWNSNLCSDPLVAKNGVLNV